MLEKTVVGVEFGERGLRDFNQEVKDFVNQVESGGYKVVNTIYSSKSCGCTKLCSVIRHKAIIVYQKI